MAKPTQVYKPSRGTSAQQVSNDVQTAEELCQSSGVRFTEKRKKLLEVLLTSATPLSAYELVDCYRDHHGQELQVMTAYRILDFLIEENLVHKLNVNNKYVACNRIRCCDGHKVSQFMVCTECDKVEEVLIPSSIWNDIANCGESLGFSLEKAHLEIACVCKACESKAPE